MRGFSSAQKRLNILYACKGESQLNDLKPLAHVLGEEFGDIIKYDMVSNTEQYSSLKNPYDYNCVFSGWDGGLNQVVLDD